jgi:aspartyl/asparaginyl beta-hydroxylase (cupin superfamily)
MGNAVPGSDASLRPEALLDLARDSEARQQHDDAFLAYYRAIILSQRGGRWHDAATTPPQLLDRVRHAMRYVKSGRRQFFVRTLEPVYARHGRGTLARFERCLANLLGDSAELPQDPRQRPRVLFFPGLPPTPYFGRESFPWIEGLERATGAIREELLAAMGRDGVGERVFDGDAAEALGLAGHDVKPAWNGIYFYRHGERRTESHALCPRTSSALDALPLARIREHAPEVMFSVLTPGTHILPHRGVTNTRAVCHLPLVVPENCAIVVGGERHDWREGHAVVFDDTYEHEAWNRGSGTRVVLILDVWHPQLTEAERDAVAALVAAMGDLNRAAGV